MRTCTRCGERFPESEFYSPRWSKCRACAAIVRRERAAARADGSYTPRNRAARRATGQRGPRADRWEDRGFGIEIEYIGPNHAVAAAMRTAGLACSVESYGHGRNTGWKIVTDASVSGGYELVSPVLYGADGERQVRGAYAALRQVGCTVNVQCGLHVHHDARDFNISEVRGVVDLYESLRGAVDSVIARGRRVGGPQGSWARPWRGTGEYNTLGIVRDIAQMHAHFRASAYERYHAVNVCAHARHGSLEFRQHQATLNANKAMAWVRLTGAMMHAGATGQAVTPDFDGMLSMVPADTDYWVARRAVFAHRDGRSVAA